MKRRSPCYQAGSVFSSPGPQPLMHQVGPAGYDFYRYNDMKVMGPMLDICQEFDLTVLFHSGDAPRDLPYLQAQTSIQFPKIFANTSKNPLT